MSDPAPSNATEFTVSEISYAVKSSIEDQFGYVRVRGELGRVSRPASGHVYLDLKDDKSVLSGVIWRGQASRLAVKPEQGLEVIATGKLTTFPGQSKYQMVIDHMEPAGAGALMALLEERKKKLAAEGLFAKERKKPLPHLPRVIGVITSPTGAVIRDILHRVQDRFPVHVLVWPVRVQGESCAEEVAAGVRGFNALPADGPIPRPDLLIVARGGGSLEDLWGFNEEAPCRAVADSDIPVISAVGHETDVTLIDYVADLRAPTPTGAAELALPVRSELVATLGDLGLRQYGAVARMMDRRRADLRSAARALPQPRDILALARQRFDMASGRLDQGLVSLTQNRRSRLEVASSRLRPGLISDRVRYQRERLEDRNNRLQKSLVSSTQTRRAHLDSTAIRLRGGLVTERTKNHKQRLADLGDRLTNSSMLTRKQKRSMLDSASRLLDSLSYKGVLDRGFVMVRDRDGSPIRRAELVNPGQGLSLQFADGHVNATASLIDPFVPSDEDVAPVASAPLPTEAGLGSEQGAGIMGAAAISAEDIEAHLLSIAGKRARRRVVRRKAPVTAEKAEAATKAEGKAGKESLDSSTPPLETAEDERLVEELESSVQAAEEVSTQRLEEATAKLAKTIEQEILARLKEQAKQGRARKKAEKDGNKDGKDDNVQGTLF
ncbi:Exodeoxyribonuclease VII large subunit [Cohaesibacter sp. ES.047]|nr:exodeoxyribonuclease VII large subunit [Cohaesibacter sp. ES.047]SNY92059.1 Exodeoxyribonuclease VII large subunit [Cohaesibacter sp. ES.047]